MKLLHTSDWHIGRTLCDRKRHDEFETFLSWMADTLRQQAVDVLLLAGDVFDTTTPGPRAQELYYRFLSQATSSGCRHVVIIAGNHDSPAFLNAPSALLKALHVHVIGCCCGNPEDEVLVLRDRTGKPELIVAAVPYLRDRDIRTAEAGESVETKEQKLIDGIRDHYAAVAARAARLRAELDPGLPIIALGHLFTAGGRTIDGDGVRELYIGNLAHVTTAIFPDCFDYLALGHLHVPQKVSDQEHIRYSGSPLPMGFGEAKQQKSVCLVDFANTPPAVELLPVPVLQPLESIKGDWNTIAGRLDALAAAGASTWLEIVYNGAEIIADLQERVQKAVAGTNLEILLNRREKAPGQALQPLQPGESLDDLDAEEVFLRCLERSNIPAEQRPELLRTYRETLASLQADDLQQAE